MNVTIKHANNISVNIASNGKGGEQDWVGAEINVFFLLVRTGRSNTTDGRTDGRTDKLSIRVVISWLQMKYIIN